MGTASTHVVAPVAARPLTGRLAEAPPGARVRAADTERVRTRPPGAGPALREATLGRLFGFNVVESAALDSGTALMYHESAFAFASLVPVAPSGAANSGSASKDGVTVRVLFDYDASTLSDRAVISVMAGATAIAEDSPATDFRRVYKVELDGTSRACPVDLLIVCPR